ncbi:DUF7282 domain-containing protein [Haloarchaeobius iranensis]|uniref:PGF-CTERM protein n=1 Tax=Haloarchaeobius iranensis TaxID=996166 RepID=A0A1G9SBP1_9EURY|nr:PGF-CTERM sorting domain-containing protein [Haloarchaeobius iranensis]SDM32839.1 PGF-CTERM protein [Haloarchaeobius iranensis]
MSRPPQFVAAITVLVVTAVLLPAVSVGAPPGGSGDSVGPTTSTAAVDSNATQTVENETAVSLWAGPPGLAERVDDADELPDHIGDLSRQSNVVPPNGSLVIRVQLPGLDAQVRNATGTNRTERFLSVADDPALNLRLWVLQDGPMETRFAALSPANATVVRGDSPDTYHLVVEPRDLPAVPATGDTELQYVGNDTGGPLAFAPSPAELDHEPYESGSGRLYFTADFAHHDGPPEHTRLARAPPTLTVARPAPGIALVDREDATIHGTTSLPPGTSVDVRVETADGDVVAATTATVHANSSGPDVWPGRPNGWSTAVDATSLPADADLSVVATVDWRENAVTERVDAAVVPDESLLEPRLRIQRVSNDTDPANLPDYVGLDGPSTPTVLLGDDLVVTVQSAVIAAEVEDAPGDNLTERFAAAWDGDTRLLVGHDHRPDHAPPRVFDLADAGNVTVVAGDAPATYHVVPDSSTAAIFRGEPSPDSREPRLEYVYERSTFLVGFNLFDEFAPRPYDLPPNQTAQVETPRAAIEYDTDGAVLGRPSGNVTIDGGTSLPAAAELTIELLDANSMSVLERVRTNPVPARETGTDFDGRFSATFEHDTRQGVDYAVRATWNGRNLTDPVPLEVVPREASLGLENETARWGMFVNETVLTHGGFVVLREGSVDGPVFATEYVYPDDTRSGVRFEEAIEEPTTVVAVAYRDVNDNYEFDTSDEPYREDGEPVTATAVIRPPEETATPTATTAPGSIVDTPATTDPTTPTLGMSDPNDTDDGGSVPGFGVSGTLAALLALCALVVRRR